MSFRDNLLEAYISSICLLVMMTFWFYLALDTDLAYTPNLRGFKGY
jgi:hypothetical protein